MKYDDVSWHFNGEGFPTTSTEKHAATHIGLLLKWCFVQGWASESWLLEEPIAVQAVISGAMTGSEFLLTYCDGQFTNEDLVPTGNKFIERYVLIDGLYYQDIAAFIPPIAYTVCETDVDFQKFSDMVKSRL